MKRYRSRWVLPAILVLLSAGAMAEESSDAEHGEGHRGHKNTVAGFLGITGEDRRDRAATVGIAYTRWLTPTMGISAVAEHAFGDLDFTVVAAPLVFRFGQWDFFAGPGWEFPDHNDGSEFLIRAGAEYIFEQPGYEIAPTLMLDFLDGDVVIIGGVAIGFGF